MPGGHHLGRVGALVDDQSGGMDFADLTVPPVKVNYTVAYGLSATPAPASNATLARSAHSFPVAVKLGQISATPAAKLSAAGGVRAVLSGPGISPETVTLKWQSKTAEFTASMPIPAKVKTGQTYVITIKENIGTGLIPAPRLGPTANPGNVTFKLAVKPPRLPDHRPDSRQMHTAGAYAVMPRPPSRRT